VFGTLLSLARTGRRINGRRVGVGVLAQRPHLTVRQENQSHPARRQGEEDSQEK
jgi:hypothetical protein